MTAHKTQTNLVLFGCPLGVSPSTCDPNLVGSALTSAPDGVVPRSCSASPRHAGPPGFLRPGFSGLSNAAFDRIYRLTWQPACRRKSPDFWQKRKKKARRFRHVSARHPTIPPILSSCRGPPAFASPAARQPPNDIMGVPILDGKPPWAQWSIPPVVFFLWNASFHSVIYKRGRT